MSTDTILTALLELEEAPWGEIVAGKPLNARGLSRRLRGYGITPGTIRVGDKTPRGYAREDLADAWARYLPAIADVADVADSMGDEGKAHETAAADTDDQPGTACLNLSLSLDREENEDGLSLSPRETNIRNMCNAA